MSVKLCSVRVIQTGIGSIPSVVTIAGRLVRGARLEVALERDLQSITSILDTSFIAPESSFFDNILSVRSLSPFLARFTRLFPQFAFLFFERHKVRAVS